MCVMWVTWGARAIFFYSQSFYEFSKFFTKPKNKLNIFKNCLFLPTNEINKMVMSETRKLKARIRKNGWRRKKAFYGNGI